MARPHAGGVVLGTPPSKARGMPESHPGPYRQRKSLYDHRDLEREDADAAFSRGGLRRQNLPGQAATN